MNRRSFVQLSGTAIAAAAVAPAQLFAADAPRKRNIKKAVMYGSIGMKASVMDRFKALKEAGFDGVEPNSHMNQPEVIAALKETGLQAASVCCSTHWSDTLSDPDAAVRAKGLEGCKQALRDAHAYGATSILMVVGVVNKQVSNDDCWKRSTEQLYKAIPTAKELKVRIAIENVWNQFIFTPTEAVHYVDQFKSPWVGWHFDVGNCINFGFPEHWIHALGPRIAKLHIKEYSRKIRDQKGPYAGFNVEFLKGDDDWPTVMKALDDIKYEGWAITEQGGADSLEGMKKLSTELDQILAS